MNITVRQENQNDYHTVYEVVKAAFKDAEHTDGEEQNLVSRLRKGDAFIPELSLVAQTQDGEIIGHILFTKGRVNDTTQLVLAPVSVLPQWQGKGIGGMLIGEGHRIAKEMGYEFSILVGHAAYYPRFGYLPAGQFGIVSSMELPDDVFMALNLQGKDTKLNGTLVYPPEFGI